VKVMSNKENSTPISNLTQVTLEQIKDMVDVSTIVGEPINLPNKITVIPICKVSYGFASGGSDLPSKLDKNLFGGGAGAGISIKPEGFLIVTPDGAQYVPAGPAPNDPISSTITAIPGAVEKVMGFFNKKKEEKRKFDSGETELD